jgi:hypothetical protein
MKRPITLVTVMLWFVVTAVSAYFYVITRINSPDAAPGYETDWDFQLLMFAIVRLPLFVGALVLLLWLERRRRRESNRAN